MKKAALLALGISLIANVANAQFYFRAGAGYAVPQAGQTLDGNATPYSGTRSNSTYSVSYDMKNVSFSSGAQAVLGFGYMFNDHVGVQLDGSFGLANTKYSFTDQNVNLGGGYQGNVHINMKAKSPVVLMPSLVLQTGGSSAWNLYTRFGAALPLMSSISNEQVIFVPSVSVTETITSKLTSSFSLGFAAAAGLQYKISDKTTFWAELNMLSMSLMLKEVTYQTATINGVTYPLDSLSIPPSIKYSKNAIVDTNYNTLPTYSLPFSNLGVHIGFTFLLSEKKNKRSDAADNRKAKSYRRR